MKRVLFLSALLSLSVSAVSAASAASPDAKKTIFCNLDVYGDAISPSGQCTGDKLVRGVQGGNVYCATPRVYCYGADREELNVRMTDEEVSETER